MNEPGTSLLRVRFRGPSSKEAVRGAKVAAGLLTDGEQLSATLDSGLMTIGGCPSAHKPRATSRLVTLRKAFCSSRRPAVEAGPGNAGEASNLATSYADLIPADRAIAQSLARKIGRDPDVVESNISVTNDFNTTIVRLLFSDSYPAVALKGARFWRIRFRARTVSAQIAPRSLTIVHFRAR